MALTEKQIREKIHEKLVALFPDAKILKRNPYTSPRDQWAGVFKHEYPAASGLLVTHGWFIRRYSIDPAISHQDDIMGYQIMVGFGLDFGSDLVNSEDVFQANLDAVNEALKDDQAFFDYVGENDEVVPEAILWDTIGIIPAGTAEFIHFASGKMRLRVVRC